MTQEEKLEAIRHSICHLMSMAVQKLYPGVGLGFGPPIEDGFYQDYGLLPEPLSAEILPKLEKEIKKMIKENIGFEKREVSFEEALKFYKHDPYKTEMINDLKAAGEKNVTFYKSGWFDNLCKGPHVASTKEIDPEGFKLTRIAGAYWKGSEKNEMLTRIYGVAFASKNDLDDYLKRQEEAQKRDHRKLGKELDLFVFSDLVGPGLPLFTPKGTIIKRILERWIEDEERRRGYLQTATPDVARVALYEKSGHWQHYKGDMYPAMEIYDDQYVMRPMTCPHQFMIYNSRPRSYRELPLRYSEISRLYRREKSGELFGLIRHAGGWSFADAHIICAPEQVEEEFASVLDLIQFVMKTLNISQFWYRFSKWDPENKKDKYVNNPEAWESSQGAMKKILDNMHLNYVEAEDEAAFYGPKLDVQLKNINGKDETAFTVQIDFALPEKFDMTYIDKEGKKKRPIVIHRGSIGCLERTIAFLIEHYAGNFPLWLSPVQVKVLPISEEHLSYAKEVFNKLKAEDIRVEIDSENETLGKKIRRAKLEKVPYFVVIGSKEKESGTLTLEARDSKESASITVNGLVAKLKKESAEKVIEKNPDELMSEGVKYARNLRREGFFTYLVSTDFWDPESEYMEELRKAAARVENLTRVFVVRDNDSLKLKPLRKQIELDLKAGINLYYIHINDVLSLTQTVDFGIWDDDYVCIVFDSKGESPRILTLSNKKDIDHYLGIKEGILKKAKPIKAVGDLD